MIAASATSSAAMKLIVPLLAGASVILLDRFFEDFFYFVVDVVDVLDDGVFCHRRWRLQGHGRPRRQRRRDPTRRRQRDGGCCTRCGLHRPVGYNVFPGQLADLWAVEIGQRLVFGDRQSSSQIQTEVFRCEDVLCFGDRVVARARCNPTRLSRQLLFRHLPCIGTSRGSLEH